MLVEHTNPTSGRACPQALKREAVQWKTQYAENLHQQAKDELDRIMQWLQETNRQLKREINDLDDVRQARGSPATHDVRSA